MYFSNTKKLIKEKDKINVINYTDSIKKSKFILTHQRISTSGFEEEYNQPFMSKDDGFVLIHNGIINDFKGEIGSDTYGYFHNHFLKGFKEETGSREKKIIKTISKTLFDCSGSYSIAIYDTKRDVMYYFRNFNKDINFFKSDDDKMLYITTRKNNKDYLHFFNRKFSEMKIEDNRIYKITVGKNINVKKVGKINIKPRERKKPYVSTYSQNGSYNRSRGICSHHRNSSNYGKKKLEDIFSASEIISKENNEKLGTMFNKHFTNINDYDSQLLDEFLVCGLTLRDLGYGEISDGEVCSTCCENASFTDSYGNPFCSDCIRVQQENIDDDFNEAETSLNYLGVENDRY